MANLNCSRYYHRSVNIRYVGLLSSQPPYGVEE